MPEIAGGFVAQRCQQQGILTETPASLQTIYQASLSLLYKLLFLLYGEARGLLPMTNLRLSRTEPDRRRPVGG